MALLELVPNISEGRVPSVVDAVIEAFLRPGVRLLDVDGNRGAHRTVLTLVGEGPALVEAAVAGAKVAAKLIDLRVHQGVHVRMGALDVCPFVPLASLEHADELAPGSSMVAAVVAAREAGLRIGEAGVPVYLYGEAALEPHRRLLNEVRRKGFEWLAPRMVHDPPDYGPRVPHPSAGATAVGAREFLVAFNVNLTTADPEVAEAVARRVREWSSVRRDERGHVTTVTPGRLKGVRAKGWFVEDFGCAQVSTNVTDFRASPPHEVLRAVREEANALGADVRGCELIGCVPLLALRLAARSVGVGDDRGADAQIAAAAEVLGLSSVKPFDPRKKVLELALGARPETGGSP